MENAAISGAIIELGETDLWVTVAHLDGRFSAPMLIMGAQPGQFPASASVAGRLWSWGRADTRVEGDLLVSGFLSQMDGPPVVVGAKEFPAAYLVGRQIAALLRLLRLSDPLSDVAILHPTGMSEAAQTTVDAVLRRSPFIVGDVTWIPRPIAAIAVSADSWTRSFEAVGILRVGTSTTEAAVWSGSVEEGELIQWWSAPRVSGSVEEAVDALGSAVATVGLDAVDEVVIVGGGKDVPALVDAAQYRFGVPIVTVDALSRAFGERAAAMLLAEQEHHPDAYFGASTASLSKHVVRRETHPLAYHAASHRRAVVPARIARIAVAAAVVVAAGTGTAAALASRNANEGIVTGSPAIVLPAALRAPAYAPEGSVVGSAEVPMGTATTSNGYMVPNWLQGIVPTAPTATSTRPVLTPVALPSPSPSSSTTSPSPSSSASAATTPATTPLNTKTGAAPRPGTSTSAPSGPGTSPAPVPTPSPSSTPSTPTLIDASRLRPRRHLATPPLDADLDDADPRRRPRRPPADPDLDGRP